MIAPPPVNLARSGWSPRFFWGFQAAFWLVGALWLMVLMTIFMPVNHLGITLAGRVTTGVLVTSLLHYFYQTSFMRSQKRSARWLIVIVLTTGLSVACTFIWMRFINNPELPELKSPHPFYNITMSRLFGLLVWNTAYFGIDLLQNSHAIKLDAAQAKLTARAGELKQLQDQLNPHFLFNALNIVKASTADPRIAAEAVQTLADYLRFCLQASRPLEPLSRELDALELYLSLQYIRFQDDLDCSIEASPDAMKAMVPPMLVQPLLENAFKYGARTSAMPLRIHVRAYENRGWLIISVANSGVWLPSARKDSAPADADAGTGIGLTNLRRRLALVYGEQATLEIGDVDAMVTATLRLPLIQAASEPL